MRANIESSFPEVGQRDTIGYVCFVDMAHDLYVLSHSCLQCLDCRNDLEGQLEPCAARGEEEVQGATLKIEHFSSLARISPPKEPYETAAMEMQRLDSAVAIPPFDEKNGDETTISTSPERDSGLKSPNQKEVTQCRLLALPPELQLAIWEFAVSSPTPLLLNCPCDSSYGGWTPQYYADRERWAQGTLHPPYQPPITRVCRSIRADALPMFYKLNAFQAGYCYETDMEIVVAWLKGIGRENRMMLNGFYFYDRNERHDENCAKDLKRIVRGRVVRELGGRMESRYDGTCCRHEVVFEPEEEVWEGVVMERMFDEK